ncbi:MAG: hypothetical protein SPE01_08675, partial [Candidatus Spyradocola sp.]|nr:hypothetical protein [Candidatus Spyradocola sp.]
LSEGRSPGGRAFWKKQSGGLFLENKPTGTPEQLEQLFRCAYGGAQPWSMSVSEETVQWTVSGE